MHIVRHIIMIGKTERSPRTIISKKMAKSSKHVQFETKINKNAKINGIHGNDQNKAERSKMDL